MEQNTNKRFGYDGREHVAMDGSTVTRIRRLSGLKMWELAKLLGIQQSLLSRLERGQAPGTEELEGKIEKVHEDYKAKKLRYGTPWSILRSLVADGYSYRTLGEACGGSRGIVKDWERGVEQLDNESLETLLDLPLISRLSRRSH